MWDNTGLECVIPIDAYKISESADFLAALEGTQNEYKNKIGGIIKMLELRARANSQRHYEIYTLKTSGDITKEHLEEMFKNSPQFSADLVREKGIKIFSDRVKEKVVIF